MPRSVPRSVPRSLTLQNGEKGYEGILSMYPKYSGREFLPELSGDDVSSSSHCHVAGKFMVLDTMLAIIKATTNDKVVLVSNYTQVVVFVPHYPDDRRLTCLRPCRVLVDMALCDWTVRCPLRSVPRLSSASTTLKFVLNHLIHSHHTGK